MKNSAGVDRIIATDYFDGPIEGFARIASLHFYFRKHAEHNAADLETYTLHAMDHHLFSELERAVGAIDSSSRVFIYSGANDGANRMVDEALVTFRARAEAKARIVSGYDLFEAAKL